MIRRKKLELGIIALVLVLTNNVRSQETCSHQCKMPRGTQRLSYKEETTYGYEFSSKLNLILPNTQDVKTNTQVTTTAFLTPQNGCAFVLQLRNFKIIGPNEKIYENIVGIEKPVTFQYLDGAVGADICAEADDSSQSLNVKRAIISFFQLDSYGRQTDVFGVCPTKSVVEDDNGDAVVRRTRDLNSCEKRENMQQNFMVETLRDKKVLEAVPILNSNFVSVQRLTGGILKHAHILEKYESMNNGVNASVQSVLQYVGTVEEMKPNLRSTQTKSIIFDPIPTPLRKSTRSALMEILQNFAADGQGVTDVTARRFLNLIKIMRDSTKEDLIYVYKLIQNSYFRKIMLDALLRCGTSEALMIAFELESGNEFKPSEKALLYQGFAYIRYPTREVLQMAADLLSNNRLSNETYLGIGTLVRRYCEQHTCPDDVVDDITKKFVLKLGSANKIETMYALKALSNAKHLPEAVTHQVLGFAQNPQKDARIRSAAFDVLTNFACTSELHNGLLEVLQNTEEDSEMRIKSFLVLAKCPSRHVAEAIELLVNNEPSIQVGGFIASHVKTLRNVLSTIDIQKTYPQNTRKYSFTGEAPYKFGGFTSKTKADVIYSQKSFLPRVAKVNVTADVFGSDVNVMEVELRQRNFDRMLEQLTGPMGMFKREAAQWHGPYSDVDLDLDFSVKLFGSDILFLSVSEKSGRFMDRLYGSIAKDVNSKINFEVDMQNSMVFVDSQLSYPTSMGFPLRLSVEGVSSMQVLVQPDARYLPGLSPSVDLDVTVGISLDAVVIESGVKAITKLHVATGVLFHSVEDEIKISLPLQQQEAAVSHDIFFNQREFGEPETLKQVRFPMNDVVTECVQGFSDYTGLDLCLELNAPPPSNNEYLAGSYRAALVLNNTDFSYLSLSQRSVVEKKMTQFSAKFVGRDQNTKTGATVEVSTEEGVMARVSAALPKQNVSAELRYTNTKSEISVFADFRLDKKKFFGKLGVGMDRKPNKETYSPLVYVAVPGKFDKQDYLVNAKGSVVVQSKSHDLKVDLEDLQLIVQVDPNAKVYSADGNFGRNKNGYFSDVTISDGRTIIQTINKLRLESARTKLVMHLTNNRRPQLNLHLDYELVNKAKNFSSLLELVHGADAKSKLNRLTVNNELNLDDNVGINRVHNKVMYPAGKFVVVADFERTNRSVTLDAEFKAGGYIYGAKLNSTFEFGEQKANLTLYDWEKQIEVTASHIGRYRYDRLQFAVMLPQLPFSYELKKYTYVNGLLETKEDNELYSLVVNDSSSKYFEYNHTRTKGVEGTYNLLLSYGNHHIVGDAHNDHAKTVGNLVVEMPGDVNFKLELLCDLTSEIHVETALYPYLRRFPSYKYLFKTRTGGEKQSLYSRNSLTAENIEGDPNNNAKLTLEVFQTSPSYRELWATVSHNERFEYNFRTRRYFDYQNRKEGLIVNVYPKREADGITFEGISKFGPGGASYVVTIDAFDHQEKHLVNVTLGRQEVAVTVHVATQLYDGIKADLKMMVIDKDYFNVEVEASVMTDAIDCKLDGHVYCFRDEGNAMVSFTNGRSQPKKLTVNYILTRSELDVHLNVHDGNDPILRSHTTFAVTDTHWYLRGNGIFLDKPFTLRATTETYNYDTSLEIKVKDEPVVFARVLLPRTSSALHIEFKFVGSTHTEHILLKLDNVENGTVKIQSDCVDFYTDTEWTYEPCMLALNHTSRLHGIELRLSNSPKVHINTIQYHISVNDNTIITGSTNVSISDSRSYNFNSTLALRTSSRRMVVDCRYNTTKHLATLNFDFYPNKLQSPHKTSLNAICDHSVRHREKLEVKLIDPNLPKDLAVLYAIQYEPHQVRQYLVLDVFKRAEDKIVYGYEIVRTEQLYSETTEIRSEGLEFLGRYGKKYVVQKDPDAHFEYVYDSKIRLGKKKYINSLVMKSMGNEATFNLTAFNNQVVMARARRSGAPIRMFVTGDLELIGVAPVQARLTTNNFASLNFDAGFKNDLARNNTFQIRAKVFGGDVACARATKNNTVLTLTCLSMKGNRLNFDYRYNASRVLGLVLRPARSVIKQSWDVFTTLITQTTVFDDMQQVYSRISDATPNFKRFLEYYREDKEAFVKELEDEAAFPDLNLQIATVVDFIYQTNRFLLQDFYIYNKEFITSYMFTDVRSINQNSMLTAKLQDVIYEALLDLNQRLGENEKAIRESGEDFFRHFDEAFAFANVIENSLLEAYRNFKDTEVFMKLASRLDGGPPASAKLIHYYNKIMTELRSNTDSVEMMKFIDLLSDYTEKKLKKEHVDDEIALKKINAALEDVLIYIYNDDSFSWKTLSLLMEIGWLHLGMTYESRRLIHIKLDETKTIAIEEMDKFKFPQDFTGMIAQNHIFTFDGKHLTVNTNCSLLLVGDLLDKNFTITARYRGEIESIRFEDNYYVVEVYKDGFTKTNNKRWNADHSVKVRKDYDYILIESVYGAQLRCSLDLITCVVKVSGYYHTHLKGLLGYANHETYDDFTLLNGKIASDSTEFVEPYTIGPCGREQVVTNALSHPQCTELFAEPTFRRCSKFVDPKPFKAACDEGLHAHIAQTKNYISRAYASYCYDRGVQITLDNSDTMTNFISY